MSALRRTNTDHEAANFSRLEATFSHTKVHLRKNSIEMKDTSRHAQAADLEAKDLDFNFRLDSSNYPLDSLQSLQDVFTAVQHDSHLKNPGNFSDETRIQCLDVNANAAGLSDLSIYTLSITDSSKHGMPLIPKACLRYSRYGAVSIIGQVQADDQGRMSQRLLIRIHCQRVQVLGAYLRCMSPIRLTREWTDIDSLVTSVPDKLTSFANRITMTQDSTMELFSSLEIDPSFIMNLLGRPDYWAPQTRWSSDSTGNLRSCGMFVSSASNQVNSG